VTKPTESPSVLPADPAGPVDPPPLGLLRRGKPASALRDVARPTRSLQNAGGLDAFCTGSTGVHHGDVGLTDERFSHACASDRVSEIV
jgi:hypothetical protein